jgi:hypothetical protein
VSHFRVLSVSAVVIDAQIAAAVLVLLEKEKTVVEVINQSALACCLQAFADTASLERCRSSAPAHAMLCCSRDRALAALRWRR